MSRQKLGQHFLRSQSILERIARAARGTVCEARVELCLEIGPGRGALTEHLLHYADRVVAVEIDRELAEALRLRLANDPRIEIVDGDAASIDLTQWGPGVLAGNLPYYVATAIVSRYLRNPGLLRHGTFLIQQEVAERITAKPGARDYGYFSVECQFLARPEYLFHVAPGAFQPPPKVDSAVVRLTPRPTEPGVNSDRFLKFVSVCFRQKRKTLRNNLAGLYSKDRLDTYPGMSRRAEELSVQDFLDLYQKMAAIESAPPIISAADAGSGTDDTTSDRAEKPGWSS